MWGPRRSRLVCGLHWFLSLSLFFSRVSTHRLIYTAGQKGKQSISDWYSRGPPYPISPDSFGFAGGQASIQGGTTTTTSTTGVTFFTAATVGAIRRKNLTRVKLLQRGSWNIKRIKAQPVAEWEPHHLFKKLMTWSTPPTCFPFFWDQTKLRTRYTKFFSFFGVGVCVCVCVPAAAAAAAQFSAYEMLNEFLIKRSSGSQEILCCVYYIVAPHLFTSRRPVVVV